MALFFCRVELKGSPSAGAYTDLHLAMRGAGFYLALQDAAGDTFSLPHAMYCQMSNASLTVINQQAINAAKSVQQDVLVLTIESAGWAGLLPKH